MLSITFDDELNVTVNGSTSTQFGHGSTAVRCSEESRR